MAALLLVSASIFLINIPFGYWRENQKKFSLRWFLAVHLPVPFVILLRIYSGIGFEWYTFLIFASAFFLGQISGSFLNRSFS